MLIVRYYNPFPLPEFMNNPFIKQFTAACSTGNALEMEHILAEWKNSTSSVSQHEATFTSDHLLQEGLVAAAEHGQGDIVKHLLSNGFRVSPGILKNDFHTL